MQQCVTIHLRRVVVVLAGLASLVVLSLAYFDVAKAEQRRDLIAYSKASGN